MQAQILNANNTIASVIESILIELLGEAASWERASTFDSLIAFNDHANKYWLPETVPEIDDSIRTVVEQLWRSRIVLNQARVIAEEVEVKNCTEQDLTEGSLSVLAKQRLEPLLESRNTDIVNLKAALDTTKKPTDDLIMECDQLRRDNRQKSLEIYRMEIEIDGLRIAVNDRNRKITELEQSLHNPIQPNLDLFREIVNQVINPALIDANDNKLRKIFSLEQELEDRKREIQYLEAVLESKNKQGEIEINDSQR